MLVVSAVVAANGISLISLVTAVAGAMALLPKRKVRSWGLPKRSNFARQQNKTITEHNTIPENDDSITSDEELELEESEQLTIDEEAEEQEQSVTLESPISSTRNLRLYRVQELNRIVASLLADSSILVTGEEGSGKTVLANAVVEKLQSDNFTVAVVEPASFKQMLLEIADQIDVQTHNLEGRALAADQLKRAISSHLDDTTAFIIIDDCHRCPAQFRLWLKQLRKQGVPMLLLATNPPRTDVFISIPRIELCPLPEYAIREIMETAALERGINLKNTDLARLQQRAGGNPMLAQRAIDEEYLGLEVETSDHRRYVDLTPMILSLGLVFMVLRFIGLGTDNRSLYLLSGIGAVIFMGFSRVLYVLPKESPNRIQQR
jgi:hypothetical protein